MIVNIKSERIIEGGSVKGLMMTYIGRRLAICWVRPQGCFWRRQEKENIA